MVDDPQSANASDTPSGNAPENAPGKAPDAPSSSPQNTDGAAAPENADFESAGNESADSQSTDFDAPTPKETADTAWGRPSDAGDPYSGGTPFSEGGAFPDDDSFASNPFTERDASGGGASSTGASGVPQEWIDQARMGWSMAKFWVKQNQRTAMLGALAAGAFIGAMLRD